MKEVSVLLVPPHRSIITEDNLISFISVSRVSYLAGNANFKEHRFQFFVPKVKNTLHICKLAVSCVFQNSFRFAVGANIYFTELRVQHVLLGGKNKEVEAE